MTEPLDEAALQAAAKAISELDVTAGQSWRSICHVHARAAILAYREALRTSSELDRLSAQIDAAGGIGAALSGVLGVPIEMVPSKRKKPAA